MAEILVTAAQTARGWTCEVTVSDGSGSTRHRVQVSREDCERLAGDASVEELVRASFAFLLERESKESILRPFDLMVIAPYFPEYERDVVRRLPGS